MSFFSEISLSEQAIQLLEEQKQTWEQCGKGYQSFALSEYKTFDCATYRVNAQFNPGRIVSSTAQVDKASIAKRKCFLCAENRPPAQKGVLWDNAFMILCNPAPIFAHHYTIASLDHAPQSILGFFEKMLLLAKRLNPEFTMIYNGPQSGASAPDHFHFQAFTSGVMPLENEALEQNRLVPIATDLYQLTRCDRSVFILQGDQTVTLTQRFENLIKIVSDVLLVNDEPMMNLIVKHYLSYWQIMIILRAKHRPDCYFREGLERFVISPGAMDMGSLIITPRQEDFERLTCELIRQIYQEVSLSNNVVQEIISRLKR
jgi:hypothetical protein